MMNYKTLRPTPEQMAAFVEHVAQAHSWYKHLGVLPGRPFVVFVAPDSGTGNRVVRAEGDSFQIVPHPAGPEYTEAHPRIHHSWRTTAEYRRRFGFLDFASESPHHGWGRDAGPPLVVPPEVMARCRFVLHAYVSPSTLSLPLHRAALQRIAAGEPHPDGDLIREWLSVRGVWEAAPKGERSKALEEQLKTIDQTLVMREMAKIRAAVDTLVAWIDEQP
jgi:hypothetical protein